MKLIQKKVFVNKEFLIENGRLIAHQKGVLKFFEADIPFEDIKINRIMKRRHIDVFWLGCLLLLSFYFFALLISKLLIPTTVAGWDLVFGLGVATTIVAAFS